MYRIALYSMLLAGLLFAMACAGRTDSEKVIASGKADGMTIRISSSTGELKKGANDLTLAFVDESGQPVEISAASLNFHMPTMGSMSAMNDKATLTTTTTAGKYNARVEIEVAGTWEAQVKYQTSRASGETSITVQAR